MVMSMMSGVMLQWQTIEWVLHEQRPCVKKHRHKKARHKQQQKMKRKKPYQATRTNGKNSRTL
jgi:hypothetical protein